MQKGTAVKKRRGNPQLVASAVVERRRRNPQLIDDFVACPAFLYGFQTALKQLQAIFPIPWIRCGARGSFEINALNAMRSRLRSEDRLLLITGGRLCLKLAERLLCFNGECAVRYALRLGASVLSRRHFFRNSSALCSDSEGAQPLCNLCGVSPDGAASGNRRLRHTMQFWLLSSDNSSATCVATLKGHRSSVWSIAFHPTVPLLVSGSSDNAVKMWR